ncbi:exonuclease domain-containing protein [Clostridium sp. J1101437_171009_A5]|uniref:exonuclease domain-containing protein n=1 Tax=Clostridium sp. J1101437_171009_A5 TaxID=2787098 RepID=UPI001897238F|nr:exonuclease domain-containing protein [Clostridium sp. J1101437_171009_A5]
MLDLFKRLFCQKQSNPLSQNISISSASSSDAEDSPEAVNVKQVEKITDILNQELDVNLERIYSRQWEFDFPNGCPDNLDQEDIEPDESPAPTTRLSQVPSYVVLDFETTGLSPECDCIIEIGAIKYIDGQEFGVMNTFVNPQCPIPAKITRLTGITDDDVSGAPTVQNAIEKLYQFIDGLPIVAHNARFDLSFLDAAYHAIGLESKLEYIDTLELARHAFPSAPNHKLSTLIRFLSIDDSQDHRALSDVRQTHALFCKCIASSKKTITPKCFHGSTQSRVASNEYHRYPKFSPKDVICTCDSLDKSHPLYQKRIVFTGQLSISRQDAAQMAADVGAIITGAVSRKTDYLVVGTQDLAIVGKNGVSSKEKKVRELNQLGATHIKIIREREFIDLVHAVEV